MDGQRTLALVHTCSRASRAAGCSPAPAPGAAAVPIPGGLADRGGRTALARSYLLEFRLILISLYFTYFKAILIMYI